LHASHHNWIDGAARPAASGETHAVHAGGSRDPIGTWPRSDVADLRAAIDAAEGGAHALRALGPEGRRALLSDAIDALLDEPDPGGLALRAIGLEEHEADVHVEPLEWTLDDVLDRRARPLADQPGGARAGPLLYACDWTEMWLQPARMVLAALLEGRSVIVMSDAHAPMLADALARALGDLPAGALAVLHDDGRTVLRAAAGEARIGSIHLASTSPAAPELVERALGTRPWPVESGFGAGVDRAGVPALAVRRLANTSFVVRSEGDLEEQARALVARSFSRAGALSGARPGRAGRALCPVRSFSSFSEHVLDALETEPDVRSPLALVRTQHVAEVERAFRLGHDEGATAISTGPEESELGFPLVFTNVEERMRLAHLERPAPILCLMRARDAVHARALAEELDAS